jgi:hypothetical protein
LGSSALFVIVKRESLSDFASGVSNDCIGIRVVCWRPVKNIDAESTLFQAIGLAFEGIFDNILEQRRIAFAAGKM